MNSTPLARSVLPGIISALALADGVLHFVLIFVLFNGRLWGRPSFGPPPGAESGAPPSPPPAPPPSNPILDVLDIRNIVGLNLNELFLLNAVGYVVLVILFWLAVRSAWKWTWIVDIVLIGYSAASIISWWNIGRPNPDGLGYLSKAIETVLIVALLVHFWMLTRTGRVDTRAAQAST